MAIDVMSTLARRLPPIGHGFLAGVGAGRAMLLLSHRTLVRAVIGCQRFYGAAGIGAALAAGMRLSRSFALPAAPFARKSTPLGGSTGLCFAPKGACAARGVGCAVAGDTDSLTVAARGTRFAGAVCGGGVRGFGRGGLPLTPVPSPLPGARGAMSLLIPIKPQRSPFAATGGEGG